jgi:S-(hydroxymethyl)glutathione dehydrogenase/alcohol dehydrogenase
MRAAVLEEQGKPIQIRDDVTIDDPGHGQVRVRVHACGICHSDVSIADGAFPTALPVILGHEAAGVVEEVGAGVTGLTPGDHVVLTPLPPCGTCYWCVRSEPGCCVNTAALMTSSFPDGRTGLRRGDAIIYRGVNMAGFAEQVLVSATGAVKVPPDLPLDVACVIGCAVQTGVGAVLNTAKVEAGANVVVFGLGGIGLNVVQGARMVGANMIVGVDLNPAREALARRFGMTHFVNPKDAGGDLVAHLVELTGGGADYSFECIGNVEVMRQALECCHRGWGVSVIIGVAGAGQEIRTRPFQLVTGRVWKGTAFGGARGRSDVPRIVDWYMDGRINIDDLITHTLPLEQINRGFDLMHAGESIRSVVVY